MIITGLKLALLGMGSVILFLLLLYLTVAVSCRFMKSSSDRELLAIENSNHSRSKKLTMKQDDELLIAVIGSAIAAYRSQS